MGMCQFTGGYKDFPICNHVLDIGPENIGYQTGIFDDGLPFEVEEYEYGEDDCKIREMSIIMPDIGVEEDDCEEYEDSDSYDGNINVEGFKYSMDIKDCSVLPIIRLRNYPMRTGIRPKLQVVK